MAFQSRSNSSRCSLSDMGKPLLFISLLFSVIGQTLAERTCDRTIAVFVMQDWSTQYLAPTAALYVHI